MKPIQNIIFFKADIQFSKIGIPFFLRHMAYKEKTIYKYKYISIQILLVNEQQGHGEPVQSTHRRGGGGGVGGMISRR